MQTPESTIATVKGSLLQRDEKLSVSHSREIVLSQEMVDGFLVSHLSIVLPDVAEELEGIRLLQLSDFHFGPATPERHVERAIRIAAPLAPDILLLTGDYLQLSTLGLHNIFKPVYFQGHEYRYSRHRRAARRHIAQLKELLSNLHAPLGTFAVLGNHDYSEGAPIIKAGLGSHVQWLINDCAAVRVGSANLYIGGLDDLRYGKVDLQKTLQQMNTLLTDSPSPRILLSHNPDVVLLEGAKALEDVDMILSGHTHGGQIRLPKIGALMTQTKQKVHVQGLSRLSNTPFYVSNGVGYGGIALRLLCPPEIVVYDLVKKGSNDATEDESHTSPSHKQW